MASELYHHPLFQVKVEHLSPDERISLSYQRARLVLQTYCECSLFAIMLTLSYRGADQVSPRQMFNFALRISGP
jgi:hypothetical protein